MWDELKLAVLFSKTGSSRTRLKGFEVVRNEQRVLAELRRGIGCASEAIAAKTDSDAREELSTAANTAYQKALHLLIHSSVPMPEPGIHEKLRQLETLLRKI